MVMQDIFLYGITQNKVAALKIQDSHFFSNSLSQEITEALFF